MSQILTLDSMKNLSIEEIIRLYQLGYRIEDLAVDPVVNFGKVTVSTGYSNIATTIILNSGDGLKLPNPSTDGQFNLVWYNSTDYPDPSDDPNREIVRVTAKSTDTLTIIRNQEGTSASNKNLSGKTYKMILSQTAKMIPDIQTDAQSRVDTHSALSSGIHGAGANYLALASGSQYTAVNKAGDTMTGTLNLPSNGITVGTSQLTISGGNVGIGTVSPSTYGSGGIGKTLELRNTGGGAPLLSFSTDQVADGTNIGAMVFATTGTAGAEKRVGYIQVASDGTSAMTTNGHMDFYISNAGILTEKMRIDKNGNVGIGTASPSGRILHISQNSSEVGIRLQSTAPGGTSHYLNTFGTGGAIPGGFSISDSIDHRFAINSNGFIGIGTTSPNSKLEVASGEIRVSDGGGPQAYRGNLSITTGVNNFFEIFGYKDGTGAGGINLILNRYGGNVGIGTVSPTYQFQLSSDSAAKPGTNTWTISSDERIKKDIRPFTDGIQTILNINPVWYKYNGKAGFKDDNEDHIGVIGQHIQNIAPYTINTYKAKLSEDDKEETELLNFNSHALTFVLINAIKEMNIKIQTLSTDNNKLKNKLANVEERLDYLKQKLIE